MEIQASRARARVGPSGEPVLLLDQDRARWDPLLVRRGLAALEGAEKLSRGAFGPYTVQAEGSLEGYHLLHSVRGDLLAKLGRAQEARKSSSAPPQ